MRSIFLLFVGTNLIFAYTGIASPEESEARFVRIAKIEGRAQILRHGVKEWEDAAVNMILVEGDRLYTDEDSYTEIQFDNGAVVKLNEKTDVEIVDLTREPDSGEEITSLYVGSGDIKVKVPRYYKPGKAFNVETPHGLLSIEEESSVRVNTNNKTEVILYNGRANAVGEKGKVSLLGGERTFIEKGRSPEHPEQFEKIVGDQFDEWSRETEEREEVLPRGERGSTSSRKYLSEEIMVGANELDCYGRWMYVHPYGWCWRPRVYVGWRPYFHGHWVYTGCWSWVWVSYEPWGWIPYHYGRWAYSWPYGWVWVPGRVWGPCWVVWCEYPGWIGWCPMGPCDGPWFSCSVHFGFGSKWVYVTKEAFKNYKYIHHPGKPYRGYKPYRYREKLPKNIEETSWSKRIPDIRPNYADKTSFADNKAIIVPHHKEIPNKEITPTGKSIRPESNRTIIPSSSGKAIPTRNESGEEISPNTPERGSKIEPKNKELKPDKYTPREKRINPSGLEPSRVNPSETKSRRSVFEHFIPFNEGKAITSPDKSEGKGRRSAEHREFYRRYKL